MVKRQQKAAKRGVPAQVPGEQRQLEEETTAAIDQTVTAIVNETCVVDVTDISEDLEVTFKTDTDRKKQQKKDEEKNM